ncbi:MAG: transglutaminase-like putative cysteine protease [Gammaproteobacteria bacterium]|jgi:transglutaminase-like putative cysteine protease
MIEFQSIESKKPSAMLMGITISILLASTLLHHGLIGLPLVMIVLCCAALRMLAFYQSSFKLSRWWLWPLSIAAMSSSIYLHGIPLGRDPGIAFLVTMSGLKILELNTRRDLRIAVLLGYFLLMSHCLFDHSPLFFLGVLLGLIALTWLLIQNSHGNAASQQWPDLKLTGKILLQALPFALILFFLIPRLSGAFWLIKTQEDGGVTGQSDTLQMGALSHLSLSTETAFDVTFKDDKLPPPNKRYWRGNVFWETDGRTWQRGSTTAIQPKAQTARIASLADVYDYEVTLRRTNQNWLFALDVPIAVPPKSTLSDDHRLTYHQDITKTIRYTVQSASNYADLTLSAEQEKRGLQLPEGAETPRLTNLLNTWKATVTSKQQIVQAALLYFNQQAFYYTLSPPLLSSSNPVDEFLFDKQRGFCEHYASAFVTLMRAANIPSRIVVGYLGGEYNPISKTMVIRQSDAHAWSEVWLDHEGWVRVDPTAAVAPQRVEQTIDFAGSREGSIRFLNADLSGLAWLSREARWLADATKANWNQWFVHYDKSRQTALLKKLKLDHFRIETLTLIAFGFALLLLNFAGLGLFFKDRVKESEVNRLYRRFTKKLQNAGVKVSPYQGPQEICEASCHLFPQFEPKLQAITQNYIDLKYGDDPRFNQLNTFKQQVRAFTLHA